MRLFASGLILIGMLFCLGVHAQQVEFEYSGRVRSAGVPFDGTGLFKFAIVSQDGAVVYWANDGVTQTNDEPTSSVPIAVSNGFFSLIMGDTSLNGMAPLESSIFNSSERLYLRMWFNDGSNGFQLLSPDRPITNSSIIGLQDNKVITLYVNDATGNDRYPGNHSQKPKKTIQAAWNALPPRIMNNVLVQIAAGSYYEMVTLTGKEVLNDAKITLRGDVNSSSSVVVSAALNRLTSTTIDRENAIRIRNQRSLRLEGLYLIQASQAALSISASSDVEISKCQFHQSLFGIQNTQFSKAMIDNVLIDNAPGGPYMVYGIINENAYMEVADTRILGPGYSAPSAPVSTLGILTNFSATAWIKNTTVDYWGIGLHAKCSGTINASRSGNIVKNCNYGALIVINANLLGVIPGNSGITYLNNSQNVVTQTGGISDY